MLGARGRFTVPGHRVVTVAPRRSRTRAVRSRRRSGAARTAGAMLRRAERAAAPDFSRVKWSTVSAGSPAGGASLARIEVGLAESWQKAEHTHCSAAGGATDEGLGGDLRGDSASQHMD